MHFGHKCSDFCAILCLRKLRPINLGGKKFIFIIINNPRLRSSSDVFGWPLVIAEYKFRNLHMQLLLLNCSENCKIKENLVSDIQQLLFETSFVGINIYEVTSERPPLWSSDQSSWLQIRRPGFDSRHYKKKVVGLERGPLSLVSTTEELLDRRVAAPV
jgi:hypothetical protein